MEVSAIELMAPAGDFSALAAALRAGANTIYFGVGKLNMRARAAGNFSIEDIEGIVRKAHVANAKAYLTLNTVVFDEEKEDIERLIQACKKNKVDAIIASDFAVIKLSNAYDVPVHFSVQCNICNYAALKHYATYGDVAVLARELSLEQIKSMIHQMRKDNLVGRSGKPFKIELFIHGALCVAVSGKCNMSLGYYGVDGSANRGACNQPCRRKYLVKDVDTHMEFSMEGDYVMSPKDICTISYLDQLLESGVEIFKIEGRGRSPEYVSVVTATYRAGIEAWKRGEFNLFLNQYQQDESLKKVFNRGFWEGGYYLGKKEGEWSKVPGNAAQENKQQVGDITKFFAKLGVAECEIKANAVKLGDEIYIIGPTTGAVRLKLDKICVGDSGEERKQAFKGEFFAFKSPVKIRKNDKVYLICKN